VYIFSHANYSEIGQTNYIFIRKGVIIMKKGIICDSSPIDQRCGILSPLEIFLKRGSKAR